MDTIKTFEFDTEAGIVLVPELTSHLYTSAVMEY